MKFSFAYAMPFQKAQSTIAASTARNGVSSYLRITVRTTLTAQAPSVGGDKPASFSSRRSSTLLEDVKGKSATKTN